MGKKKYKPRLIMARVRYSSEVETIETHIFVTYFILFVWVPKLKFKFWTDSNQHSSISQLQMLLLMVKSVICSLEKLAYYCGQKIFGWGWLESELFNQLLMSGKPKYAQWTILKNLIWKVTSLMHPNCFKVYFFQWYKSKVRHVFHEFWTEGKAISS